MTTSTVVLVHGAFADATGSWNTIADILIRRGHPVVAIANPLRGLHHDAEYLRTVLATIPGPITLAGHSYGGAVISHAATGLDRICALVYIAAFAPDEGESAGQLDEKFGGRAQQVTQARPLPGATPLKGPPHIELSIVPAQYREVFAPDTDPDTAAVLAATQRPLALAAMLEPAGPPAWKSLPSYYAISTRDQMIPTVGQREMAARMNAITIDLDAGHAATLSHPDPIADLISTASAR
ncbi:alpha/beta fold hydrolase [Nocardia acidivorans]|uniref:alpha/beta fold hydrolase n=1 Tax=Nocardia acidivorans TaxID=404580 RepID=UPI000831B11B|nr:alpha/beta hydrolase [Nocardia acidivorans]